MAVHADDLVDQFLAEAVHDGHHDDQRRNPEHDAEERETGNDGDEAFLAPRPQVAPGQQPFECRERQGARYILHGGTVASFCSDSSAGLGEQFSSTAIFPPSGSRPGVTGAAAKQKGPQRRRGPLSPGRVCRYSLVQTFMVFMPVSASVLVLNVPLSTIVVVVVVGLLSTIVHFFVVASRTT